MSSPPSFAFSKPAMLGDAVSVLVLVEDSLPMAAKWPDVRDAYLPNLLDNLRTADPSVQMHARWLTSSDTTSATLEPVHITDAAQARLAHDLPLGQAISTKLHPAVISNAISILSSVTRQQSTTRHLILVAATGPLSQGASNDATPSGFDTWDEIALVLKQHYIRLHVILSIGAEMRTYHELFKRSLQLQNNSEVPAWFQVDSRRFSIRLSGRPQYVRASVSVPIPLVPASIPEDPYNNNPSPPAASPTSVSPPPTVSTPSSPSNTASPNSRRSSTSPTTPRSRPRASNSPQSPPTTETGGGGLVHYLQQMHGLTKKKSYGIKAPKKTYADIRLPNAGRPILPRLEVPPSQSDIYTYPTFDNHHVADLQTPPTDPQPPPPRRHSADQLPSASLVVRTNNGDRRARQRGPWLPIAPLVSSTPSSPTSATSPSTLSALQSLATMTPRLPDFVTRERMPTTGMLTTTDAQSVYQMAPGAISLATATPSNASYFPGNVGAWAQQSSPMSSASSPTHTVSTSLSDASRQFQTSPPTPQLVGSEYSYGSSPPSSSSATPPSIPAPMADSLEDQPFVVSPEYEAMVNARFDEAVRSGAMQASMTSAVHSALPATMSGPTYGTSIPAPVRQEQTYYTALSPTLAQQVAAAQDAGYVVYQSHPSAHQGNGIMLDPDVQTNGGWYAVADSYAAAPVPEYAAGQWYSV